jgi:protein tyrosine phosphatase (PTP) superfamily phosphohydrolase (DUF442 family)
LACEVPSVISTTRPRLPSEAAVRSITGMAARHVPVAPEDVVHQHIEAAALVIDGCHQGGYLAGILVINHSRGARPANHRSVNTPGVRR